MGLSISQLSDKTGIKFGTSGIRGLAVNMTDYVCYSFTLGFIQYLKQISSKSFEQIAIGGDYRPSTDRMMKAIAKAVEDMGFTPVNCGKVPTPTLAYYSQVKEIPCIMVTGSHIPDDRNGIKFYKLEGEVLKSDESGMQSQVIEINESLFDANGNFVNSEDNLGESFQEEAGQLYINRYIDFFPANILKGKNIGVYQHSAVGRDLVEKIFEGLGASVTLLGFSEKFIPVDTEAIREEDVALAKKWAAEYTFDAIVSTDGDSDRPLISDENGIWVRGDISGILCAKYLKADSICTPVSCNSAVEKCNWFKNVTRTKIGSPFVIDAMNSKMEEGYKIVVGYEANGGFLIASEIEVDGKKLAPLATRDAIISPLSLVLLSIQENKPISQLQNDLPQRFTASDRIKEFPIENSQAIMAKFSVSEEDTKGEVLNVFGTDMGKVKEINRTDGLRITFDNEEVVHLRPSGNAPEFRCYTEADTEARVVELNKYCLDKLKSLV